ncbi:MAG TPA: TSUP family transporter, partial [Methylomirabilota bacterium]
MHDMAGWLILGAAAIVGSTIGGVAGFGTGVIMIPAIAWSVGVKATVPVLTVCMLVGNSARVWFSRHDIVWRVVAAFLVGAVPMTMLGATLYTRID